MKRISTAKLRRWVLVGLGVGTLVSLLLGILLTDDWGGLLLNVGAEFGGALATYGLLELFIKRREEEEVKKADLIAQMGSTVKDVSIAAAEELRRHGWLTDGSLRSAHLIDANLPGANLWRADLQGAWLERAYLQRAYLSHANLQGTWLLWANLQEAYLGWADLRGAILQEADLRGAYLGRANLQGARLGMANLQGARLGMANLQEAYLEGAKFNDNTTLPDVRKWTPDTDMARFTAPDHPDFWRPGA